MVSSGFDVSRHDFICRKRPIALITAEISVAAVEDRLGLEPLTRACTSTELLFEARHHRYDLAIRKWAFGSEFVRSNARGGV